MAGDRRERNVFPLTARISLFVYNSLLFFFEFIFYFTHYWWWKMTVLNMFQYLGVSSYGLIRKEKERLGGLDERNFLFGETGALTTKLILQEIDPPPLATVCDLGSGRGTFLFTSSFLYGTRGLGVEIIPQYIEKAKKIRKALRVGDIIFLNENYLNTDLSSADIIYMTATTLEDSVMEAMNEKFRALEPGTVIITVHRPLQGQEFEKTGEKLFPFTWGTDSVFYYQVKGRGNIHESSE